MALSVEHITSSLQHGLLSFPITDLDSEGRMNPRSYADRINWFLSHDVSAVFAAGGTGEFFSLSRNEYQQIVTTAAAAVGDRVPVISSVGRSIPEAITFARIAKEAGIHALLLMPPYLTSCPEEGIFAYAKSIMDHTDLPVIYYNRANGILSSTYIQRLADACPNFIAVKDGTSNMQELNRIIKTVGDRLSYIGGAPTAEIISEAYLSIGVNTYSSAVFNFVPELAMFFYRALRSGNSDAVQRLLTSFYLPFVELRSRKKGYAVSLIKAGATLIGRSAGKVRPPLVMPTEAETEILRRIIEQGHAEMSH
ncbi:MAG: 5-dehydro-4-deoxyglucarate dehydratase [Bacteroidota bacterium]